MSRNEIISVDRRGTGVIILPMFLVVFLGACAGEKVDPLAGPPGEVLVLELKDNLLKHIDSDEESVKMEDIYDRQLEALQNIYWKRKSLSVAFYVLFEDREATSEQFADVFEDWDLLRLEYLRTAMDLELEKRELLGQKDYKKLIKEEQDIIARSMLAETGVYQ